MLNLAEIIPKLKDFFSKDEKVLAVYVFGSTIEGYAHPGSDLDLAILFKDTISLYDELTYQSRLSELINFEQVDILNLNKAPIRLQFTVVSTGQLIYEADQLAVSDYLENLFCQYHDQAYRYYQFFKDWDEGLKEDYANDQSRQNPS
ncbi:MAG TPA: nucleotidyltransferase domain-containing protein [Firmicutes bacterium]|jgi:predicted nucleotidyltransferase|nr:nucleotidyltransferase domain-containing protein [Bacillota bacterium]HOQ23970.1 nucleotidyltransferase domain-containing protein [Bacillota bacterium]HPT67369.1 nucleotidyltransferase domain-containing protein [Bacillota bacterium]